MLSANPGRLGYVGRKPGSPSPDRDADSWYTPASDVEAAVPAVPAFPADPSPRTPSARTLYALSLFAWIKGHPSATDFEFVAMLERAEARAAKLGDAPR